MLNVIMLSVFMVSVIRLSVITLIVVGLSVIMLSVVMLSVVMLSVVMLSVMEIKLEMIQAPWGLGRFLTLPSNIRLAFKCSRYKHSSLFWLRGQVKTKSS